MKLTVAFAFSLQILFFASIAFADSFGSGANSFDIEFVTIGNPNNVADTTGTPGLPHLTGTVSYEYRIGKYEISEDMVIKANTLGGLGISHDTRGADKPATSVSWIEAVQFINWLNANSGSPLAYKFDGGNFQMWEPTDTGYDANNRYRNTQARYFLPSVDEWYKAAYYDPSGVYYDYATGSDVLPTAVASGTAAGSAVHAQSSITGPADIMLAGGLSPYETMGQSGNVREWDENDLFLVNNLASRRGVRGGDWWSDSNLMSATVRGVADATLSSNIVGFRVASTVVPEPASGLLALFGAIVVLFYRKIV